MTEDEKRVIARMWMDGCSTRVIAERVNYHWTYVSKVANELGLPRRRGVRRFTDEQLACMRTLHECGLNYSQVGELFGVDRSLARYYVRKGVTDDAGR